MTPGTVPITVNRNTPWSDDIPFEGLDFSDATFTMQVRQYRGQTGDPLIDLTNASGGAEGISCEVETTAGVPTSIVLIQIDEATIDAVLPASTNGQDAGTDVVLYWDLIIEGGGLPRTRWLEGTFTIHEGVTV